MAHPQHNFTSNFNGSDGHNAELTLNINGVEKKYTPAGNDQTYNVPGVARIDINLDGADLVQAIQTALDGAAQPVLAEMSIYDEEYVYQYIGEIDGQWYFGTCTTTKIVTITVAKEDGAVNGEQIPVANGVVIVESDGLNVYSRLRTALALGQLPVLSYVGANPVYAQYEKTSDNGDLIFVGALASASDTYVQYNIYTVASNNTVTVTTRAASAGGGGTPDDENGFFNSSLYQTPGDGATESLTLNDFRIKQGTSIHGNNIEFVVTHTEGGIDFGEVWLNPGTYILNIRYTLQWVGNPRGTFLPLVCNVGGQPFDFSFEQENTLITSQIRVVTARQKVAVAFPFDADTPPMGIWVETLSIAQIASNTHPAVVHDTTLVGSGTAGSPLGVTTDAFGKVKDIPTSISQFRTGDVIPVDGPNGPVKMEADTLLELTAENAIAGNVSPEFDSTRTIDNQYNAGEMVVKDGKLYVFRTNHYGEWNADDVYEFGLDKFIRSLPIGCVNGNVVELTGRNLTIVDYIFEVDGPRSLVISPSEIGWATDTIGGQSPVILSVDLIDGSVVTNVYKFFSSSDVDKKMYVKISAPTKVRIQYRANTGTKVKFYIEDSKTAIGVVGVNNSVLLPLDGKNLSAVSAYVPVCNSDKIVVVPDHAPWATDTVGGQNPVVLQISAYDRNSNESILAAYQITNVPKKLSLSLPRDTILLRFFFRANIGETVKFDICDISEIEYEESLSKNLENLSIANDIVHEFVGRGLAWAELTFGVENVDCIYIRPYKPAWPVDSIGGQSPSLMQVYSIDPNGLEKLIALYQNLAYIPNEVPVKRPSECSKIKIKIRANNDVVVPFTISTSSLFETYVLSREDSDFVYMNSYRRGVRRPQFIMISDPHGNQYSLNQFAKTCNSILRDVDFAICTGDICPDRPVDPGAYLAYNEMIDKISMPLLPVIGNHDVGASWYVGAFAPLSKVVENVMGPAVTKNFIPENTNGYYFKDFQDRQLRVIVLNCYENGGLYDEQSKWTRIEYNSSYPDIEFSHSYALGERVNIPGWTDYSYECNTPLTTPSGAPTEQSHDIPCWGGRRPDVVLYGHDQMQWFADTLLSTPANYSVVVALHSAFSGDVSIETEYKFCMSAEYSQDWVRQNGTIMPPGDAVADIVNAFIRGDNYSETIEYSTLAPYTVSCDFRGKNEGVKFSCFIGGHLHKDMIVRHTTYNNLFQVISSAALQNHYPNTDIAFMWDGANVRGNQTVVAVDDSAVCLMKIGYKLTDDGYLRDFEKITQNV